MATLARYPDVQSPYWIEQRGGLCRVYHRHVGLLVECDCLAEARHQISDREDAEEAEAAREALDYGDDVVMAATPDREAA